MTVELFIESLEGNAEILTRILHEFLIENIPFVDYSIKWNVPFYTYYGNLCYINPQKEHIVLGFVKGNELSNQHGNLTGDLKTVRHLLIFQTEDINQASLLDTLQEAMLLNELSRKK